MSACKSCGADITWAITDAGRMMPVDATPDPDGNVSLLRRDGAAPLATVHSRGTLFDPEPPELEGVELFTAHHQNCPQAAEWRRKKKR